MIRVASKAIRLRGPCQLLFTRLARRLRFLPLGIFWGVVTAILNADNFSQIIIAGDIEPVDWLVDWRSIVIIVGPAVFACLIATLLGSASLRRDISPIQWSVSWVVIGVSSCGASVATSGLAFSLLYNIWQSYYSLLECSSTFLSGLELIVGGTLIGWVFAFWVLIGKIVVQSLVLASSSLPVALVVRRITLGVGPVA